MLPIHKGDPHYKQGWRVKEKVSGWLRLIFADPASRNLFFFLLLNLSFAFVELAYGIWTNSLGLISDSFHMFFDCTALLAGLAASVIAKWRADPAFSYGYVRAEILAGFVNGLFLLFIAFFIFSEAIERAFEPPHVHHDRLFIISVLGFIVNLIGIFAFAHGGHGHSHGGGSHGHSHGGHSHSSAHAYGVGMGESSHSLSYSDHSHSHSDPSHKHSDHGHSHGNHGHSHSDHGHSHSDHGHSHSDHGHSHDGPSSHGHSHVDHSSPDNDKKKSSGNSQIFQGVFLHILADTLGSVGVIISSLLIEHFGWMIADPICSIFISGLIGMSVIPLLRDSIGVLMQRTPRELDYILPGAYQRVSQLEGVYSVQEPHFWTLCTDVHVGAIKLEVSKDADCTYIQSQAHNIFTQIGIRQLYVQIDTSPM